MKNTPVQLLSCLGRLIFSVAVIQQRRESKWVSSRCERERVATRVQKTNFRIKEEAAKERVYSTRALRSHCAESDTDAPMYGQRVHLGVNKLLWREIPYKISLNIFYLSRLPEFLYLDLLLKINKKTLICCTGFSTLVFFGDNCPKIIVLIFSLCARISLFLAFLFP